MSIQLGERKTALITGASRGIGRATAVELARRGYNLILNYLRNTEEAQRTLQMVEAEGAHGWLVPANVGEPDEIKMLFEEVAEHQPLSVVVHNAALGTFKDLFQIRPNQLDLAFRVNVFALLWLAKASLPLMREQGGKIIAVSSLGSHRVVPYYGIVGPSKAALEAMVRYLALELKPQGITVNAVSGGLINTDALRAFPDWESMACQAVDHTPAGRLGGPEDIAGVIGCLTEESMNWVCGQIIQADGGCTLI